MKMKEMYYPFSLETRVNLEVWVDIQQQLNKQLTHRQKKQLEEEEAFYEDNPE
jgi:hypothetical protein